MEQRLGLFTQLWGSPGPREREDVFRASLIMAASEEINRQGPAGMLQLLPLVGGRDGGEGEADGVEGKVESQKGCGWGARRGDGGLAHQGIHHNTCSLVPHLHGCTGL